MGLAIQISSCVFSYIRHGHAEKHYFKMGIAVTEDKIARLNIRLTSAEITEVREGARAAGLTVSAYARRRLLGHFVAHQGQAEAIRELRRTGGILKLLVGGPDAVQISIAFSELREAIRRVGS